MTKLGVLVRSFLDFMDLLACFRYLVKALQGFFFFSCDDDDPLNDLIKSGYKQESKKHMSILPSICLLPTST
jgi:hypothetical protein